MILRWALCENGCGTGSGSLRSGGGVVTIAIRSRYRRLGSMISRLPFLLGRLVRTSRFSGPWT